MAFIVYEIEFGTAVAGSLKPSSATAVLNAFSLLRQARGMTFETEIILVIIPADLYPSKAHWALTGEQGWCSGPSSIPGLGVKCGLSLLLVLVLAPRGFSKNQHFQIPVDSEKPREGRTN